MGKSQLLLINQKACQNGPEFLSGGHLGEDLLPLGLGKFPCPHHSPHYSLLSLARPSRIDAAHVLQTWRWEEGGEALACQAPCCFLSRHSYHAWSCGQPTPSCSVAPSLSMLKSLFFFVLLLLGCSSSHLTLDCPALCFSHMWMPCLSICSRSSLRKETFYTLLLAPFLAKPGQRIVGAQQG